MLVTYQKMIYEQETLENDMVKQVEAYAAEENAGIMVVCAKLEEELSGLEDDEKAEMLRRIWFRRIRIR